MRGMVVITASLFCAYPAHAVVLCARPRPDGTFNTSVRIREVCRPSEQVLDPVVLGLQGPPGPQGEKGDKGDAGDAGPPGIGPLTQCPADSKLVGSTCVDKYEASVWGIPPGNTALLDKVRNGTITLADLTAAGASQYGWPLPPFNLANLPTTFPANGNWTEPLYAVSVPGVLPATNVSWFQAEQACALAGKRLLTNQEWQRAAAGTPDPGNADDGIATCATNSAGPTTTGARSACTSSWGVFDMVGNVWEWVADWDERATVCTSWPGDFGGDRTCLGGDGSVTVIPGALRRGGSWFFGQDAGVFAVVNDGLASFFGSDLGFRCAR